MPQESNASGELPFGLSSDDKKPESVHKFIRLPSEVASYARKKTIQISQQVRGNNKQSMAHLSPDSEVPDI